MGICKTSDCTGGLWPVFLAAIAIYSPIPQSPTLFCAETHKVVHVKV